MYTILSVQHRILPKGGKPTRAIIQHLEAHHEHAARMSLSISSDDSTPSSLATVNCFGLAFAAVSTDSDENVVMKAPFPIVSACRAGETTPQSK